MCNLFRCVENYTILCFARRNPYVITKKRLIDGFVGVANRNGLIEVIECMDASMGMKLSNGVSSCKQQLEMCQHQIMGLFIMDDWEMDIGMGLSNAKLQKI